MLVNANPFDSAPAPKSNADAYVSSTFSVGDRTFDFAFTAGTYTSQITDTPIVYVGRWEPALPLTPGAALSGQMSLALTDSTFAPVGTTGDLYWGNGYWAQPIGTWEMDAPTDPVPEPASIALFGSSLCGLFLRKRRRA